MLKGQIIWKNESIRIIALEKVNDYAVEIFIGYDPEGNSEWKPSTSLSTDRHQYDLVIRTLANKLGAMLSRMKEEERNG